MADGSTGLFEITYLAPSGHTLQAFYGISPGTSPWKLFSQSGLHDPTRNLYVPPHRILGWREITSEEWDGEMRRRAEARAKKRQESSDD